MGRGMNDQFTDSERCALTKQRMETICTGAVRWLVNAALWENDRQKAIERSLYGDLLWSMAKAASDYAFAKNIDPDKFETDVLSEAVNCVINLRYALVHEPSDKTVDFWDSHSWPIDRIKADEVPYLDRSSLEGVVDMYLALPYRSQPMDRLLVKVLIASELYQYGDLMLNRKTLVSPSPSPLMQRHALLTYLLGLIGNSVLFGGVAALAQWARSNGWVSENSALWISGACALLFAIVVAISTFALPFGWYIQAKARKNVRKLLLAMDTIYSELKSNGPISAKYIRERASNASEEGVVWPMPLFAMLDDIISRSGRF